MPKRNSNAQFQGRPLLPPFRQGKAALRYALVQAAMVASSKNSEIRGYFSKLIHGRELECGIRLKMKVKLAAKLLVVAWTLMKTGQKFQASCFSG